MIRSRKKGSYNSRTIWVTTSGTLQLRLKQLFKPKCVFKIIYGNFKNVLFSQIRNFNDVLKDEKTDKIKLDRRITSVTYHLHG